MNLLTFQFFPIIEYPMNNAIEMFILLFVAQNKNQI